MASAMPDVGMDVIDITLTLDTSAYATGDVLAATQEITHGVLANGSQCLPVAIQILDEDDQGADIDILFFKTNVNIGTENNAFDITDAEANDLLGWIDVTGTDMTDWGGFRTVYYQSTDSAWHLGILEAAATSTSFYIAAISRGSPTYTASGLKIKLSVIHSVV